MPIQLILNDTKTSAFNLQLTLIIGEIYTKTFINKYLGKLKYVNPKMCEIQSDINYLHLYIKLLRKHIRSLLIFPFHIFTILVCLQLQYTNVIVQILHVRIRVPMQNVYKFDHEDII